MAGEAVTGNPGAFPAAHWAHKPSITPPDQRPTSMSPKLRKSNTSGYPGVTRVGKGNKWKAEIRVGGVYRYLGLFDTAKEAHAAYLRTMARIPPTGHPALSQDQIRKQLLATVRKLFEAHGIEALAVRFLMSQEKSLYQRLIKAGLNQPALLSALGLAGEYRAWRNSARRYRGKVKPKWSWETAVAAAKLILARNGDLGSVAESRKAGLSSLTSAVHRAGRTWDELRIAVGLTPSEGSHISDNGMIWTSRAQAGLSNFLHARGVAHKKGERYPLPRSKKSRRRWTRFDLHFRAETGDWIDVKVGGGASGKHPAARVMGYVQNPHFLRIPYRDCLSPAAIEKVLEPYIGILPPAKTKNAKRTLKSRRRQNRPKD
jgi:hypothetical protein